ncbi:glutathione S-transferase T2-like [Silene latifolia]|uniref:glutathione S-transferase T2-like n=1 Tax=Silene latifolia TaxID=37657 RepID=UPI003D76D712
MPSINLSENSMSDWDNEVEQNQVPETVTERSKPPSRWSVQEDEALISSFMRHSTDNMIFTNQKKAKLWVKVKKLFDEARKANPALMPKDRNPGMLGGRFRRISVGVMKSVGCYEEALRRKSNGMNEEDVIQEAHALHDETEGKFQYERAWILLKKYPKWKEIVGRYVEDNIGTSARKNKSRKTMSIDDVDIDECPDPDTPTFGSDPDSAGSGKRFRLNDGGFSTPNSEDDEVDMSRQRPQGIKEVKKNKGKMKVGEVAYLAESIDRFGDRFGEKSLAMRNCNGRK